MIFFSHFHIAQVGEDVIIQFTYNNTVLTTFIFKVVVDLGSMLCNKENMVCEIWGNLLSHGEVRMWGLLLQRVIENC